MDGVKRQVGQEWAPIRLALAQEVIEAAHKEVGVVPRHAQAVSQGGHTARVGGVGVVVIGAVIAPVTGISTPHNALIPIWKDVVATWGPRARVGVVHRKAATVRHAAGGFGLCGEPFIKPCVRNNKDIVIKMGFT
jgi:hypothetical protein